ncbi:hypothetical protein GDO78_014563 [Eleutherodactylus coqui]|uniref:Uncharacterized protein n=1 Tax=Eleutherodactylus coqui TaxID=57060 RepID=A0A8J6JQ01_ELECQ|nr:hypothetical protein GDO78_014563 [Eleutherodactylus coqui]
MIQPYCVIRPMLTCNKRYNLKSHLGKPITIDMLWHLYYEQGGLCRKREKDKSFRSHLPRIPLGNCNVL